MITQNFINILYEMHSAQVEKISGLPAKDVYGITRYLVNSFGTGTSFNSSLSISYSNKDAGISIGTDNTSASKDDYNLKNTLTSNEVTLTMVDTICEIDGNNNFNFICVLGIRNKTNNTININEVGWKANIYVSRFPFQRESGITTPILLDRTILETPLTLNSNETGTIKYQIRNNIPFTYKNGIKLVSWSYGADEEIVAMITAAHEGLIDLQEDAGWKIGDIRKINVDSFMAESTQISARDTYIQISSFEDYNNCGCVMQIDWYGNSFLTRLHSSTSNVKYATSILHTQVLPALIEALPQWLSQSLLTFDILVKETSSSTTPTTVSNNKLALRSVSELFGGNDVLLEGEQIELYKNIYAILKGPPATFLTNTHEAYWTRTPYSSSSFCYVSGSLSNLPSGASSRSVTNSYMIAPFGCL